MKPSLKSGLRVLLIMVLVLTALSCGPSRFTMLLEMKQPSKSGVNLNGKTVSVVYLENGNRLQDDFASYMAASFSESLQNDYGTGKGSVGVFRMPMAEGADYSVKDTLVNLLIDTGSDVVFLFDTTKFGVMTLGTSDKLSEPVSADSAYINTGSVPYTIKLYCFDAMNQKEEVRTFGGTSVAQPAVYSAGKETDEQLKVQLATALSKEGWNVGQVIASSFAPQWKEEGFSIIYFDSEKWITALEKANQFQWKQAMDIWLGLVDSKDIMKRSCAAYNMAVACYISGEYKLALEWLNLSNLEYELQMSDSLRKKISAQMN